MAQAPNQIASYWGVDPSVVPSTSSDEDEAIRRYWGMAGEAPAAAAPTAASGLSGGFASMPPIDPSWTQPAPSPSSTAPATPPANPIAHSPPPAGVPVPGGSQPGQGPKLGQLEQYAASRGIPPMPPPAPPQPPPQRVTLPPVPIVGSPARARGGRGTTRSADPFGIQAAQTAQVGALGKQMEAMGRARDAEQTAALHTAERMATLSRIQEEDAAIAAAEREQASRLYRDQMDEVARQLDDVRTRKIDPLKEFHDEPALGALAVVGSLVGGFYQGLTGGTSNQFLEHLNRHIDRAYEEQERQIRDEKFALGERMNLLQAQRQSLLDDESARLQFRNMAYEAIKNEIAAEAERLGTDAARANADAGIAQVELAQAQLIEQIGIRKQQQANAAASAAMAQRKAIQQTFLHTYEKLLTEGFSPAEAESEANRITNLTHFGVVTPRPAGSEGTGEMRLDRRARARIAAEKHEAQQALDANIDAIDKILNDPKALQAATEGTTLGAAYASIMPRWAPGAESAIKNVNARDAINMRIEAAIEGAYKATTGGVPSAHVLETWPEPFKIKTSDTPELGAQRLRNLKRFLIELARTKGASGTTPDEMLRSLGAERVTSED